MEDMFKEMSYEYMNVGKGHSKNCGVFCSGLTAEE